ncbi:unnamed protein product [Prunus armeniaca]|uniref:Uncharacterized protein n=1 Tax=Prunus armeniaca TaxID=36596 RepID=A0A6J5Y6F1_PRUAR|nr:unnamed protein product [Prunus armeniaca]CAB4319545.1 unnamed protein product [Prunus armeniaca]
MMNKLKKLKSGKRGCFLHQPILTTTAVDERHLLQTVNDSLKAMRSEGVLIDLTLYNYPFGDLALNVAFDVKLAQDLLMSVTMWVPGIVKLDCRGMMIYALGSEQFVTAIIDGNAA